MFCSSIFRMIEEYLWGFPSFTSPALQSCCLETVLEFVTVPKGNNCAQNRNFSTLASCIIGFSLLLPVVACLPVYIDVLFLCLSHTFFILFLQITLPLLYPEGATMHVPFDVTMIKSEVTRCDMKSLFWVSTSLFVSQHKINLHIKMDAGKSCVQVLFLATLALNWSDCWNGWIQGK